MKDKDIDNQIVKVGPENAVPEPVPVTDFVGEAIIAGITVRGAVLYPDSEEPIRVFIQREIVGLLTGNKKGGLDRYLRAKNLQPYLPEKFKNMSLDQATMKLRSAKNGRLAQGYIGADVIDLCRMYMTAQADGKILPSQLHLAKQAAVIVFSFAKSGVDNFIDNITGYEKVRKDYELVRNLGRYVSAEINRFVNQFPIEFYKEIFRLNGWPYDDENVKKRPPVVGKWTNEMIYERFPKGVLAKIQERNPVIKPGYRRYKNYNLLTEEVGLPELQEYISNAIFLMKVAPNWRKFRGMLRRALGKEYEQDLWEQNIR